MQASIKSGFYCEMHLIYTLTKFCLRNFMSGNLVDWESADWRVDNMVRETRPFDEVCLLPKSRSIGFPELRSNSDYKLLCNKLKGG